MKLKKMLAAVLTMAMVATALPVTAFAAEADLTIKTAADLIAFAEAVNDGDEFSKKTVVLGADIDLNNKEWTPISQGDTTFKGTFDGQNHTISNLFVDEVKEVASEDGYAGLFGKLQGGIIKNLKLDGVTITTEMDAGEFTVIGGVVGQAYTGKIENVQVVDLEITGSSKYVGGITGHGYADIKGCRVEGEITPDVAAQVGGIIGMQAGDISDCYVNAKISGGYTVAGGIVGFANGTEGADKINDCYVAGSIEHHAPYYGSEGNGSNVGGVVAYGWGIGEKFLVENCYVDTKFVDKDGNEAAAENAMYIVANCGGDYGTNEVFEVVNCSWSAEAESYTLYGYQNADNGYVYDTIAKSSACDYAAGMSYIKFIGGEDVEVEVADDVTAGDSKVNVADDVEITIDADVIQSAVTNTDTKNTLVSAAEAKAETPKDEDVLAALGKDVVENAESVEVSVVPRLDIEFVSVSAKDNTITLNIEAVYDVIAEVTDGDGDTEEFTLKKDQELNTVGKTVVVTIPVPSELEGEVNIYHMKDTGETYHYTATVTDGVVSFENEHGFSTFYVTAELAKVATENGIFGSLQDAIDEAEDGDTITLLSDIEQTVMPTGDSTTNADNCVAHIPADKEVTIDLNGYSIIAKGDDEALYDTLAIRNNGILTITDTSENKDGKITLSYSGKKESGTSQIHSTILNFGTLTVENGIIENTATSGQATHGIYNYSWGGNAKLTINGGTISSAKGYSVYSSAYDDFSKNVCTVEITDGTLTDGVYYSNTGAHAEDGASLTISGGKIEADNNYEDAIYVSEANSGDIKLSITGGTFEGNVTYTAQYKKTAEFVAGGTYTAAAAETILANGLLTNSVGAMLTSADNSTVGFYENVETAREAGNNGDKIAEIQNGEVVEGSETIIESEIVPTPSTSSSKKSSKKYTASIDNDEIENGSVKLSSTSAKKGATVTITVTPNEGYELDELTVLDKDGNEVKLTDKGNGKYTFVMPKGGVEIEASFKEIDEEPAVDEPADDEEVLVLTINQLIYQLNGSYEANDVAPIIKGDRTMLPIRLIAEFLGATVTWSEAEQSVTIVKDDTTIVIYIGQAFALVNGEPVQLDEATFIQNDRTYLPLRFVAENLGATVTWDGVNQTVTIVPGK